MTFLIFFVRNTIFIFKSVDGDKLVAVANGTALVNVSYAGNDKYKAAESKVIEVNVTKIETSIDVEESGDMKVGDNVKLNATLSPADAGELDYTSSDVSVVTVNGIGELDAVGEGNATITVKFLGDDKYAAAESKNITVTVGLKDASVSVNNDTLNLLIDDEFVLVATTVPEGLNVIFTPDNYGVVSVDENGVVSALKEGNATVKISVGGDGVYALNTTDVAVTVKKIPTKIIVGDDVSMSIGGSAVITVSFFGDDKYAAAESKNITVTVDKLDATVDVSVPENITVGDNSTVNVVLPKNATGNVTVKVDGEVVGTAPVKDGSADVTIPFMSAGNHNVEITYSGDDKYNSASKTATVSVGKQSTQVSAADVTATYNVNKYLVITLKDSNGNPLVNAKVTVELSAAINYTTDENGQVKVKVSNLVPKTYAAKITFAGNSNYLGSDATAKVIVKKANPKITASTKKFKTTTKTKKYTITLKDNAGKAIKKAKVYLKVNGKTYKATTNSKGKATFKITKLNKKGSFKAVVTYKGNKYYNKATKKATIKVVSVWKTISKGSKLKTTVKKIQRALKNNGYYLTAHGHYLKVDGIYWDYTVKAVKQFQKAKGLKVTGKVDEKTAKKLGII